jgi:hypothetical protein
MAFTNSIVLAKATGIIDTIQKLTPKEREARPNRVFIDDYNKLRKFALELAPDLEPLFPPEIEEVENAYGMSRMPATFAEICAYCQQIAGFLRTGI